MTQPLAFDPATLLTKLAVAANNQTRDPSTRDALHEAHDAIEALVNFSNRIIEERDVAIRETAHWSARFIDVNRKLEKYVEQEEKRRRGPPPNEDGRVNPAA